jgi:hypothetical protein
MKEPHVGFVGEGAGVGGHDDFFFVETLEGFVISSAFMFSDVTEHTNNHIAKIFIMCSTWNIGLT